MFYVNLIIRQAQEPREVGENFFLPNIINHQI